MNPRSYSFRLLAPLCELYLAFSDYVRFATTAGKERHREKLSCEGLVYSVMPYFQLNSLAEIASQTAVAHGIGGGTVTNGRACQPRAVTRPSEGMLANP